MQPIDKSNLPIDNIGVNKENISPNRSPPPDFELKEPPRYLLCNETGQDETLSALAENYSNIGGSHIGFALWMNLNIIAEAKSDQAIIADFDPEITSTLELVKETVLISDNREMFVEEFIHALKELPNCPDPFLILGRTGGMNEETFRKEITSRGWLSSDDRFNHVRNLYSQGKIHHAIADITNHEFFSKVKEWLSKTGTKATTAYTSNIGEWILQNKGQNGLDQLANDFREILDADSVYIDAQRKSKIGGESPKQRITIGSKLPEIAYRAPKRRAPPGRLGGSERPPKLKF